MGSEPAMSMQSLLLLASVTLSTALWSTPLAPEAENAPCDKSSMAKCEKLAQAMLVSCSHAETAKEVTKNGGYQVPDYCSRISHKATDADACAQLVGVTRDQFETKNATDLREFL